MSKFPMPLNEIAALLSFNLSETKVITGLASLENARPDQLSFCESQKYLDRLNASIAGACFMTESLAKLCPAHITPLIVPDPQNKFVELTKIFHQNYLVPQNFYAEKHDYSDAIIHDDAEIEQDVTIDPNVIIASGVIIGQGTYISAGAVIGENVTIGRFCSIGANVVLQHCHIGNGVILHSGAKIGQDGFGFRPKVGGHDKIPQISRVIIQDNVEIGANTTVDRGSIRDTIIGEGTKIDNLVQIGHNAVIGRNCLIVAFVALAGSCTLEDNVTLAGFVSVNNNVTIGEGALILATSAVKDNVPKKGRYGGAPAKPMRDWFREIAAVEKLGRETRQEKDKNDE